MRGSVSGTALAMPSAVASENSRRRMSTNANADPAKGNRPERAGEQNYVRVELLDADGEVIEGHARNDCDLIHVDDGNHTVTWKGNSDVSGLAGEGPRTQTHRFLDEGASCPSTVLAPQSLCVFVPRVRAGRSALDRSQGAAIGPAGRSG